jgi:hypothetical protein
MPTSSTNGGSANALHKKLRDGKVVFRVRIHKKRARTRVGPHYLSPATQALTVSFTGPRNLTSTQALTPTSSGCSSSLATTLCTFTYTLPPGSYTASFATYDAVTGCPSSCSIPGSAKELSTAQAIPFTVTAGASNSVPLTLSGVPSSMLVLPATPTSILNVARGIDMLGLGAHQLLVETLDADGNFIFGAGSPTFTVAQTSGSLGVVLGNPTTASPNVFAVTPPSTFASSNATLTVSASYAGQATNGCASNPSACTTTQVVDMKQLFATYSYGSVLVYETGQTTPYAQISNGISNMDALTFDANGNLYVANCNAGCGYGSTSDSIAVFAPPYNGQPALLTTGIYGPQTIAVHGSQLFVGNCASCSLGGTDSFSIYSLPATSISAPVGSNSNGVKDPQSFAFDSTGDLFVADCASCAPGGTDAVTEYASPYTGAATTLPAAGLNQPVALALDHSNNVAVASSNGGSGGFVTVYLGAPSYAGAATIVAAADSTTFSKPVALATDIGGTEFLIADNGNDQVYLCGPAFTTQCGTGSTIHTGVNAPTGVAEDGLGNLYVANNGGNNVTSYAAGAFTGAVTTISTGGDTPFGIAVLP